MNLGTEEIKDLDKFVKQLQKKFKLTTFEALQIAIKVYKTDELISSINDVTETLETKLNSVVNQLHEVAYKIHRLDARN